eukprot:1020213-Amphidinium_carterae.2
MASIAMAVSCCRSETWEHGCVGHTSHVSYPVYLTCNVRDVAHIVAEVDQNWVGINDGSAERARWWGNGLAFKSRGKEEPVIAVLPH